MYASYFLFGWFFKILNPKPDGFLSGFIYLFFPVLTLCAISFILGSIIGMIVGKKNHIIEIFKSKSILYGGLIGAGLMLILGFIYIIPTGITSQISNYLFGSKGTFQNSLQALFLLFIAFALGSITGWFIGKIKSKV